MNFKSDDYIKVGKIIYCHHGIYIGDGKVIHYGGEKNNKKNATIVQESSLEEFADNRVICLVQHSTYPRDTIDRAVKSLARRGYNLFENNCEHFANYCVSGKRESKQVGNALVVVKFVCIMLPILIMPITYQRVLLNKI